MKILLRVGIVLVILLIGLFVAAQVIVNRPFVREKVTKILGEKLQREVSLAGMSLSFFPSIGLNLKEFTISEKNKKDSFASLDNLQVRAKLFPLLKKQVVVKEIVLDRPKINVVRDAQGQFNFSDWMGASTAESAPVAEGASTQTSPAPKISIDLVRVNDGEFSYRSVQASGEPQTFKISGLDLSVDDFSFETPVSIRLSCSVLDSQLSLKGKVGPFTGPLDKMEATLEIALKGLTIQDLSAYLPKEALQGIRGFENLSIQGDLSGGLAKGITGDLDIALTLLPVGKDLRLKASLEAKTLGDIILKELSFKVGSSDLLLQGRFQDLLVQTETSGKTPKIDLTLSSNQIVLDDFLLVEGSESGSVQGQSEQAASPGPENPLFGNTTFQNTQGSFVAQLKKIQVKANELSDLVLRLKLNRGLLSIEEFSVIAYGGKVSGQGQVNLQKEKIGYDTRLDMEGIQLEKISAANLGKEKIQGTVTGSGSLKGLGLARADLERTLTGNAKLEVKEGKIIGSNVKADILAKMDNPILMQFLPGLAKMREEAQSRPNNETVFRDFVIDLALAGGKANLQKMNLATDDFNLRGSGQVDFALQSNLEAHVVFSKSFTESMTRGKDLSDTLPYENGGLLIPIRITGSLTKPVVMPDLATLIAALTKGQLKERVGGLLGGGEEGKKASPLSKILGGDKDKEGKKSPLQGIFGGGGESEGQEGQKEEESKLPFKLF